MLMSMETNGNTQISKLVVWYFAINEISIFLPDVQVLAQGKEQTIGDFYPSSIAICL